MASAVEDMQAGVGDAAGFDHALWLPLTLVLDFVFAAHVWGVYATANRLTEVRVALLVASAGLSFVALVPFSYVDAHELQMTQSLSEAGVVFTLVMQVAVITRDAMRQCNLTSLRYFMHGAELVAAVGVVVATLTLADVPSALSVHRVYENVALGFIFSFRYYYITLSRGSVSAAIKKQPLTTSLYALLVTHECPFFVARQAIASSTSTTGEALQGFYMRVLVLLCIWANARDHAASRARRQRKRTTPQTSRRISRRRNLSSIAPQSSATHTRHRSTSLAARRVQSLLSSRSLRRVYQQHGSVVAPQPTHSAMSVFMTSFAGAVNSLTREK